MYLTRRRRCLPSREECYCPKYKRNLSLRHSFARRRRSGTSMKEIFWQQDAGVGSRVFFSLRNIRFITRIPRDGPPQDVSSYLDPMIPYLYLLNKRGDCTKTNVNHQCKSPETHVFSEETFPSGLLPIQPISNRCFPWKPLYQICTPSTSCTSQLMIYYHASNHPVVYVYDDYILPAPAL